MKNFLFYLLVAVFAILVLIFITNPGLLDNIWLWLVGFAGGIAGVIRNFFDQIKHFFAGERQKTAENNDTQASQSESNNKNKLVNLIHTIENQQAAQTGNSKFQGTTLTVLRYIDDGDTTLGLLFIRDKFFAYTLEDTYHKEKIKNETRIPAGEYALDFLKQNTGLTQKYRDKFNWFNYHLEIKNVPDYTGVYIHIGNDKDDTAGCLLIADGVNAATIEKSIMYSTKAYERFYKRIKALIDADEKIRLVIHDENWFQPNNFNAVNIAGL